MHDYSPPNLLPNADIDRVQARVVRPASSAFAPLFVPLALVGAVHSMPSPTHSCSVAQPVRLALALALPLSTPAATLWPAACPAPSPAAWQLAPGIHSARSANRAACADSCVSLASAARLLPPSAHSSARRAPLPPPLPPPRSRATALVRAAPAPPCPPTAHLIGSVPSCCVRDLPRPRLRWRPATHIHWRDTNPLSESLAENAARRYSKSSARRHRVPPPRHCSRRLAVAPHATAASQSSGPLPARSGSWHYRRGSPVVPDACGRHGCGSDNS